MALAGKLEINFELKCSADKFFEVLSRQAHQIPNASSGEIHAIEVHEGDWVATGSVKLWTYTIDGKPEVFKEKVEVDEVNKSVSLIAVGGHVLEQYKSYKITLKTVSMAEGGVVKILLDYEKLKPDDPPPNKYLDFVIKVVKDIDEHLVKA
ncbi:hypothetical protein Peur_042456 [Populus x canadensis]|uniref:Bet v I/Major latex protein domain-containing protein n=2 Tax=Populus TaxID=3689 RepID=A0A8T2Y6D7_POPDE|nr:unknown [Populus trichocarpa x Populus deltoides]KAH8500620.1 hypothetical protein H0E87_015743 [Populus deltoides]KAH8500725.1 hypothetical protein H0E87_015812 [Populus deltoides]